MSIFIYLEYVGWLTNVLRSAGGVHGSKKKLADAIGCQPSYLSLVLKGRSHLSLEQAERLSRLWQMSVEETDYLFLLIELARAGTQELKSHFRTRVVAARAAHENLSKRIKNVEIFPEDEAAIYFSNWQYLAIHILISIPAYQTPQAISHRLQISEESALRVLQYLQELGFAELKQGKWKSTRRQLHLPKDSRFISLHHSNWRQRSVDSAFLSKPEDIHYTGVSSISKNDLETLKQMALRLIDDSRKLIAPSKEEELICFSLDLFKV